VCFAPVMAGLHSNESLCLYQSQHSPSCKGRTMLALIIDFLHGHQGKCSLSSLGENGCSTEACDGKKVWHKLFETVLTSGTRVVPQ
jgi:hypothetical protein